MTPALDLDALRRIAEQATPGPWSAEDIGSASSVWGVIAGDVAIILHDCVSGPDARHIAAFNPAVALAMLERLREAEARVRTLEQEQAVRNTWFTARA